ncbi:zinc transporter 7-B [Drosophila busckii]|uniref:zinc transporter 7-B n=1 Tax=Drosophila busckii TaxID=30019 RepID=UPI00143285BD|nr:zinc transporter 7-B [Drosophila busckii]
MKMFACLLACVSLAQAGFIGALGGGSGYGHDGGSVAVVKVIHEEGHAHGGGGEGFDHGHAHGGEVQIVKIIHEQSHGHDHGHGEVHLVKVIHEHGDSFGGAASYGGGSSGVWAAGGSGWN